MKLIYIIFLLPLISLTGNFNPDGNINEMLKKAEALQQKRKYKSAAALAVKIQDLAREKQRDIAYVEAVKIELLAKRWFDMESFEKALHCLNKNINNAFGRTQPLLRAWKMHAVKSWYSRNQHKLRQNVDDGIINEEPEQWSKHDVLAIIDKEVEAVRKLNTRAKLTSDEIKQLSAANVVDGAKPANVSDWVILSAIQAVRDFDGDYLFTSENLYAPAKVFIKNFIQHNTSHPLETMSHYYALLLNVREKQQSSYFWHLNLARLRDIYKKDETYNKIRLYQNALEPLTRINAPAMSLASARLAGIYQAYAGQANAADNPKQALKWQQKAIELCEHAIKKYPDSYGVAKCRDLLDNIRQPLLNIDLQAYVQPGKEIPVRIAYKNQKYVKITAYRINADDYMSAGYQRRSFVPKKQEKIWQKQFRLPQKPGYFKHSLIATLPSFPEGFFYMQLDTEKQLSKNNHNRDELLINTTSMAIVSKPVSGKTGVFVMNRNTGELVDRCDIKLFDRKYNYHTRKSIFEPELQKTITGGKFEVEKGQRADYLQCIQQDDTLVVRFRSNYWREPSKRPNQQVKFFTDRSIYRPGQMLHFKAIFGENITNDWSPVKDEPISVKLIDANHQTVASRRFQTNSRGSFNGSFKIPDETRPGKMRLRTAYGSYAFDVQYYKRPTFNAEWIMPKRPTKPGEAVEIDLKCAAFTGAPIQHAVVKTTVKLSSDFFKWWYPQSSEMVVSGFTDTTGKDGVANINFQSLPDRQSQRYTIESSVILPDGAQREFQYNYTVANHPLNVQLQGAGDIIKADQQPDIKIRGVNGESVDESVRLEVRPLQVPEDYFYHMPFRSADTILNTQKQWQKHYPGMAFNRALQPSEMPKNQPLFTYSAPGKELSFPKDEKLKEGWYAFDFIIADSLYTTRYLKISDLQRRKCKVPTPLALFVDKKSVKPGEQVKIHLTSRFPDAHIQLLVFDQKGEILSKQINISSQKQSFNVPVHSRSEGNFFISAVLIRRGQKFRVFDQVKVKPVSRLIDVKFLSIRNKIIPGEQEQWTISLRKNNKPLAGAGVLASMYDMSLDVFKTHRWPLPFQIQHYHFNHFRTSGFSNNSFGWYAPSAPHKKKPLHWYLKNPFTYGARTGGVRRPMLQEASPKKNATAEKTMEKEPETKPGEAEKQQEADKKGRETKTQKPVSLRTNFNETAFFYPELESNEKGEVQLKFTAPESMSRWKLQILAQDDKMAAGYAKHEVVTQKPLMVIPNKLRFLHQGDEITIQAMVYNNTDSILKVQPGAVITNPVTEEKTPVKLSEQNIELKPGTSNSFAVSFEVPGNWNVLNYQVTGRSGDYTDGELHGIPVLPSRQQIINTMTLWNKSGQEKTYKFQSLEKLDSETAAQHELTFELTTNPLWFAVKSMPAVYKSSARSAIQLSRNFRITATGNHLIQAYPPIQKVFKIWKEAQPEALRSKLRKNTDLRNLLLSETPWQQIAADQELQRGLLMEMLNPNFVQQKMVSAINKLENQQASNGAFSWRPGMRPSYYFTLQTTYNLAQTLNYAGEQKQAARQIISDALPYLNKQIQQRYRNLLNYHADTADYVSSAAVMRYFFVNKTMDEKYQPRNEAEQYFYRHALKYKKMHLRQLTMSGYLAALFGNRDYAMLVIDRLRERAVVDETKGIYWKQNQYGWNWDEAPVSTQALITNFFQHMQQPVEEIEAMKLWLIRQKQGQAWRNANASLAAVQCLLTTGKDWIQNEQPVTIKIGNLTVKSDEVPAEAGTGYFQKTISHPEKAMEHIVVDNPGQTPVWGGVYHSFTESFANIEPWQDELSITRKLFRVRQTDKGEKIDLLNTENDVLKVGDRIRVQLTVQSERELDYVWIRSPHAACFEPVKQLSGYQWKSGLFYYAESHDSERRFFFNRLKNGTFVLQYDLYVERYGKLNAGPAEIQSAYAPEFAAHTGGYCVMVE